MNFYGFLNKCVQALSVTVSVLGNRKCATFMRLPLYPMISVQEGPFWDQKTVTVPGLSVAYIYHKNLYIMGNVVIGAKGTRFESRSGQDTLFYVICPSFEQGRKPHIEQLVWYLT